MSNYFSHAFKNKQWVVSYETVRHGFVYYAGRFMYGLRWQDALLLTRQGANNVARSLKRAGYKKVRIKYQSIPSTRNMYR